MIIFNLTINPFINLMNLTNYDRVDGNFANCVLLVDKQPNGGRIFRELILFKIFNSNLDQRKKYSRVLCCVTMINNKS